MNGMEKRLHSIKHGVLDWMGRGKCIRNQSWNGNGVKWKKQESAQRVLIHTANYFGTDMEIRIRNGMNEKEKLK